MTLATSRRRGMPAVGSRRRAVIACAAPEKEQTLIETLREFEIEPVPSKSMDVIRALLTSDETVLAFSQTKFGEWCFQDVLNAADSPGAKVPVVVCSEFYDNDLYVYVMAMGAFDFLAFPYRQEEVKWIIHTALNRGSGRLEALRRGAA